MTTTIIDQIKQCAATNQKLLAILLDPEKVRIDRIEEIAKRLKKTKADYIFVGGSTVAPGQSSQLVKALKKCSDLKIILFPGDFSQVTNEADGLLFLSLLSGRNPEYLIEQQIKSVPYLKTSSLEIIPTGYILIDGGKETSVQKISKTKPIARNNLEFAVQTAIAGMYKGKSLVYLEAGSGAIHHVPIKMIAAVKKELNIPLIVGGGIKTRNQLNKIYKAGADLIVVGTAFENNTFNYE